MLPHLLRMCQQHLVLSLLTKTKQDRVISILSQAHPISIVCTCAQLLMLMFNTTDIITSSIGVCDSVLSGDILPVTDF